MIDNRMLREYEIAKKLIALINKQLDEHDKQIDERLRIIEMLAKLPAHA